MNDDTAKELALVRSKRPISRRHCDCLRMVTGKEQEAAGDVLWRDFLPDHLLREDSVALVG